jgi:hypothetical protein
LLLARQVTHRNVVRIHDLGEIDGIKYITMSYVDGRDLATLLKEVGQLSIPMTLRIMRSIVSGLVAAHAAGVVPSRPQAREHHDRHDGEALIMDFGIARSTGGPADGALPPARAAAPEGVRATGRTNRCHRPGRRRRALWNTWRRSRPAAKPSISGPISTRPD